MATNILTPTQYRLSKADREVIIAGIPLEIQYPLGVVPDLVLQKNSEYFPALRGRTNMSQLEMAQIMSAEVTLKGLFLSKNTVTFSANE